MMCLVSMWLLLFFLFRCELGYYFGSVWVQFWFYVGFSWFHLGFTSFRGYLVSSLVVYLGFVCV